jgi:beta-glucanase (GH16 family)
MSGLGPERQTLPMLVAVQIPRLYQTMRSFGSIGFLFTAALAASLCTGCAGVTHSASTPPQTFELSGTLSPASLGSGATVKLGGAANMSATADSSGSFSFTGLASGSYTVTPSRNGDTFSPVSQNVVVSGANVSVPSFTVTAQTYSLAGTVSPAAAGSGATLALSGSANATTTANSSGNFSFNGLANGTYTVTATKAGFAFSPGSQSETINGANVMGVGFTANGQGFSISGTITGGNGASVALSGAASGSTTVDGSGNFSFSGLGNGSYTLTPTKAGFTFSPSSQAETVNGANITGVSFVATAQTFSVSGTVSGGPGASVALSGAASASTTANGSGIYTFAGLANGNYTVTASKTGFTISPSSQSASIAGANVTGVNFTATPLTYSLSGSISPTAVGAGASLTLSGASTATTTANGSGIYTFTGLVNGSYAVTPSKTGYSFNPTAQAATINGANATGLNFTATPVAPTYSISGSITPASSGGAGATVTLSGAASFTIIADASGNYSFTSLTNGSYTITPSSSTATFSPTSQAATVNNASVAAVNFTATATANVLFFDDFTGSTLSSAWTILNREGDQSNAEEQCYTPNNVSVSNSFLVLTTQVQSISCGDSDHAPSLWNYTSGDVQWSTLNFTYGTIEYRAKMAGGQGTWPAIWLLGFNCQQSNISSADNVGSCNWPSPGSDEIDITEILFSNHTMVNQEIHSNGHNDGCQPTNIADVSQNYHVYQLVWAPGSLQWKIDGTTTCTVTQSYVPDTAMFLIINTAVGGAGGSPNNSSLPQSTSVDYVKVTQP